MSGPEWLELVRRSRSLIPEELLDTPAVRSPALDRALGCRVLLKDECLGPIGSFKGRGTEVLFRRRVFEGPVACASAGNFGQGIAWSASARGVRSIVYAATAASPLKVERMRRLGAEVRLVGRDLDEAKDIARTEAERFGWTFLEDGREEEMFLGAATISQELEETGERFDVLLCPVGNGALFGGLAGWFALRGLPARRFGVVASEAPSMALSFEAGVPVSTEPAQTVADGIAVRVPVALGVERVNAFADEILTVSETSLAEGVRLLHSTTGLVVEPAGAAAVAALLEHGSRFKGLQVAAPLCGGNLDPERLAAILGGP